MKLILAALLLALVSLAAVPEWYSDYKLELAIRKADFYEEQARDLRVTLRDIEQLNAELRLEVSSEKAASTERINTLEDELEVANGIVTAIAQIDSLENQIMGLISSRDYLTEQVSVVAGQVAIAQAHLAGARAATVNINTMVGAFTPDMGTVGCRTFPGVSMTPTFHNNSLVCITQNVSYIQNNVGIGAIVIAPCSTFGPGVSVIHRVHVVVDGKWQLKGDHNRTPDSCLQSTSDITWIVVGFVKDPY